MTDFLGILNKILTAISNSFVSNSKNKIYELLSLHKELSNNELKELAEKAINGELELKKENKTFSVYNFIKSWLPIRQEVNYKENYLISIGVEVFRRSPADLEDTELFPEQITAAIALTQRCVIQMDTGEGKTYAILPAAFSLICRYSQVYIVCANPYLAHRDAIRTKRYWDFLGLDIGLGLTSSKIDNWKCPIIYTTIDNLISKYNMDLLKKIKPEVQINFNAIIIDEVDTVLIDDAIRRFSIIQGINSDLFDWEEILLFINLLTDDEDIIVNRVDLTSNLTEKGVLKLENWLKEKNIPINFINIQRLRAASEIAYIAKNIVKENQHYVRKGDSIYAVNLVTGKVKYSSTPNWLVPLEYNINNKTRSETVSKTTIDYIVFIKKFNHLSGISGSVQNDIMEYFFAYLLPVIIIKPRKKRYNGLEQDLVFRTKKEAKNSLVYKITKSVNERRPVLVGTQNIDDAEELFRLLKQSKNLSEIAKIILITAKNEHEIAKSFQTSGEVGTVTIATQLAGRGVDIRLSSESLDNGGLSLFGLERGREIRFDRQFLGRAGRQGEPFKAIFFVSLEDDLMKLFGSERIAKVMDSIGYEEGEVIQHSMINNAIIRAQLKIRKHNFYIRRTQDLQYAVKAEIHERFIKWVSYLQTPSNDEMLCSDSFINHILSNFTSNNFSYLKSSKKIVTYDKAKQIVESISELTSLSENIVKTIDFEGREEQVAFERISNMLKQVINKKIEVYVNLKQKSDSFFKKHFNIKKRFPRMIAYWSIYQIWMNFINYKTPRIRATSNMQSLNHIEFQRLFSEKLLNAWEAEEKNIASFILFNLFQLDSPENLNELFFYEDNEVFLDENFDPNINLVREWDSELTTDKNIKPIYDPIKKDKNIVKLFINQIDENNFSFGYSKESLNFALENFVRLSPINTLNSSEKVFTAIKEYYIWEAKTAGIATKYKKKHHEWLRKFLIYLRNRNLIADLPSIRVKSKTTIKRFLKNISDIKTISQIAQFIFFLISFFLLSKIGTWVNPKSLTGIWIHLDNLICAGFFSKGIITAPIFLALIASNSIIGLKFAKILNWAVSSVIICFIFDWNIKQVNFLEIISNILIFLLIFWLTDFCRKLCENTHRLYNISLISVWLLYCSLFIFIPHLYFDIFIISGFFVCLGVQYFWRYHYNYLEFSLASSVQTGSTSSMTFETVTSIRKIEGFIGIIQHFYAIIGAYITSVMLEMSLSILQYELNNIILVLVPTLTYLTISISIAFNLINNLFSEKRWRTKLVKAGESIVETDGCGKIVKHESINIFLNKNKTWIILKSTFLQVFVLVIFLLCSKNKYLEGTQLPLSLVYSFITFFVFVLGSELIQKVYNTFFIKLPINYEPIELDEIPEPEVDDSLFGRLRKILEPNSPIASVLKFIYSVITIGYLILLMYTKMFP